MENIEAQKIINRIQKEIITTGIEPAKLVKALQQLREYALEEGNPTLTKVLRLTYEHISEYGAFYVPIPDEEPVDEIDGDAIEHEEFESTADNDPAESLNYLLSIMSNCNNKSNMNELREYRNALINYTGNN